MLELANIKAEVVEVESHQDFHKRVKFPNGYGASIVRGPYTYGGSEGLYEVAVLNINNDITYDTPITDDVIGNLTESDVIHILNQIAALPKEQIINAPR